ncbi:CAP domain-containing protein [Streptomyces sp. MZ04]|uniref:CAP domain-containing protein n=1 Tax=Streptomyces sp. MZ04 TaxID=2559236 RepID=UPI0032AEEC8B
MTLGSATAAVGLSVGFASAAITPGGAEEHARSAAFDAPGREGPSPEAKVIALVNKERDKAGCSPLTKNAELTEAAHDYNEVMAETGVLSHTGPDGSTPQSRAEAAGYTAYVGENIAEGYPDAESVMEGWMDSPGHRANILNCDYKEIGVDANFADNGPWWIQDFGTGS